MKKIFTFLAFVLTAMIAHAGFNDGKISITNLGMQSVRVEIDGKQHNNRDRMLIINDLQPGYHYIKVYRQNNRDGRRGNNGISRNQLVYSGKIRIKPRYHVDIVINRFGKALVDEQVMDQRYEQEYGNDDDYVYDRDDRDRDDDRYGRPGRDDRYPDRDDRYYNRPMNDQSFNALLETMKREAFESTRLSLTKQSVVNSYFTTVQVKQLLLLFTFDNNRLDMAKHLYGSTVDKENYFQLYDALTFSRSKEELAAYIREYK